MNLFRFGILIALVGIASLFLPMFGMHLNPLARFGSNAQAIGIGIVVVGGVMAFLGMRHDD